MYVPTFCGLDGDIDGRKLTSDEQNEDFSARGQEIHQRKAVLTGDQTVRRL
jgi:hypothetical protein